MQPNLTLMNIRVYNFEPLLDKCNIAQVHTMIQVLDSSLIAYQQSIMHFALCITYKYTCQVNFGLGF